jgi:RimJ/RimL family protein N-acetyltransferase
MGLTCTVLPRSDRKNIKRKEEAMVSKEDLVFRQVVTLRDGARVLLRPLLKEDRQAMLDMFLPISFDERRFMRHNVNDPDVINSWIDNIDYDKIFPLVCLVGDRIVGNGTLHFHEGPARHRCEMRLFLSKEFRRRGLGNKLIQALIEHAKRRGMYMVEVEIVSDHVEVIKAMQQCGFRTLVTYENYYMLPDGEMRDVLHLALYLRTVDSEF